MGRTEHPKNGRFLRMIRMRTLSVNLKEVPSDLVSVELQYNVIHF